MKDLAPDLGIAYNSGVPKTYRQARRFAKSQSRRRIAGPGPISSRTPPRGGFESMTYLLYKVLRKLPRSVLLGLLLVLLTAVARA
jgi:hypothetical protein